MTKITYIPGEIANAAIDITGKRKPVTRTQHIFDDAKGKSQSEVNADIDGEIAEIKGGSTDSISTLNQKIATEQGRAQGAEQGLDNRLSTVEELAEISVGGGDIGIATAADFESDNPSDLAKVPTIGAMLGVANDGVYDISARHNGTKYADLAEALGTNGANIPQSLRKGGMSVKFVQSSDNKYVQFRCKTQSFSTNPEDWYFEGDDTLVNNPEFVEAKTDCEGKILWAIKTDGSIYFGTGCPPQVKAYIQQKIEELSFDEYEDIVAFLGSLITGDKNLQGLLNERVSKEEGKSLIDEDVANRVHYTENPEFIDIKIDAEDNILEGIKTNGTKIVNIPIETPSTIISGTNDKEDRMEITLDKEDKVLSYREKDGTYVEKVGIKSPHISSENVQTNHLETDNVSLTTEAILYLANKTNQEIAKSIEALYPKETIGVILQNYKFGKQKFGENYYLDWNNHQISHPIYLPLTLLWFSDIHENKDNLRRIRAFYELHKDYIDDVIFTGDACLSSYIHDLVYPYWTENGGIPFLFVIGNHDSCTQLSPYTPISPKEVYDTYIKDFIGYTNIIATENKGYWYKIYPDAKSPECDGGIRFIALDQYHWKEKEVIGDYVPSTYADGTSVDTGQQLEWFISQLNTAKVNGQAVIVGVHSPNNEVVGVDSVFNNPDEEKLPTASYTEIRTEMFEAVQDFIDGGGEFICWMAGHMHQDWFVHPTNYPNQIIIAISCASCTIGPRDVYMPEGTKSMDRMNIISFDTWRKYIRLYRIGIDFDRHGRRIESMVYDYNNKVVIYNN